MRSSDRDHGVAGPGELQIEITNTGEASRLHLRGELDIATADALRSAVADVLGAGAREVVLELEGVVFLDSTGLSAIIDSVQRARRAGGRVRCEAPLGHETRLVIGLAKLEDLLELSEPPPA